MKAEERLGKWKRLLVGKRRGEDTEWVWSKHNVPFFLNFYYIYIYVDIYISTYKPKY